MTHTHRVLSSTLRNSDGRHIAEILWCADPENCPQTKALKVLRQERDGGVLSLPGAKLLAELECLEMSI